MKTTLLIPVVNELTGMRQILPRIQRDWVDEIIVMDGGSTDGSFEYAQSLGLAAFRQNSIGIMNAYSEGLKIATGDVIIPFSPDGNSVPEKIPELVRKMQEGFDMVIVSRYFDGAKSQDDDFVSAFGNWMFTKLINVLFGGRYTDSLVMFRAWKREIAERLDVDPSIAGFEPELSIECAKKKLKVAEIPGDEPKRIGGQTKKRTLRAGWAILILMAQELMKPTRASAASKAAPLASMERTIKS